MSTEDRNEIALEIADDILSRAEYCEVYEHEDADDWTDEDMQAIHRLITTATATLGGEETK